MRYQVLNKLETEDNLSKLFSAYMGKIHVIDMMAFPRGSMRRLKENQCFDHQMEYKTTTTYELITMRNSFVSIQQNIVWALEKLKEFETEYSYDALHYASCERMTSIRKHGSELDSDYNEDGSVRFKKDRKSLKDYTVHGSLEQYFESNDNEHRNELIGTSRPCDFGYYTNAVQRSTDFCIFKMLKKFDGREIPVYQEDTDGEMKAMGIAEKMEAEINEDIVNENIIHLFELVLVDGIEAAEIYNSLKPFKDETPKYKELQFRLNRMLNLTYNLTDLSKR